VERVKSRFERQLPVMMVFVSGVSGDRAKKQRATKQSWFAGSKMLARCAASGPAA